MAKDGNTKTIWERNFLNMDVLIDLIKDIWDFLKVRKKLNEESNSELEGYKKDQAEKEREREEIRKRYEEQLAEARKVRSIVFNPQTGKFQELKKK